MATTHGNNLSFDEPSFRILLIRQGYRSVAALSRTAGVSPGYGQQIARGLIPPSETREKIARALGIPAEQIWRPHKSSTRSTIHDAVGGTTGVPLTQPARRRPTMVT